MKKKKPVTKNLLYLKIFIGIYLLYMAYSCLKNISQIDPAMQWLAYIFIALFAAAGIYYIYLNVMRIKNKEYEETDITGQPMDGGDENITGVSPEDAEGDKAEEETAN